MVLSKLNAKISPRTLAWPIRESPEKRLKFAQWQEVTLAKDWTQSSPPVRCMENISSCCQRAVLRRGIPVTLLQMLQGHRKPFSWTALKKFNRQKFGQTHIFFLAEFPTFRLPTPESVLPYRLNLKENGEENWRHTSEQRLQLRWLSGCQPLPYLPHPHSSPKHGGNSNQIQVVEYRNSRGSVSKGTAIKLS